jgi:glycosyltransferase involved in cell wall biosynthesis
MNKILIVGQTPPPYYGQALMIQRTLEGDYGNDIEIHHLRMSFSSNIKEIGKFKIGKVFHLMKLIISIYWIRFTKKTTVLFYFPAGPDNVPLVRDLILLGSTRWLFEKTIYQFRAAGLGEFISSKSVLYQTVIKKVYGKPSVAIILSEYSPKDYLPFNPKKVKILNNGIEDIPSRFKYEFNDDVIRFCYLGSLKESKGVFDLLESYGNMDNEIISELHLIGTTDDERIMQRIKILAADIIKTKNKTVILHGELLGKEKHDKISYCDVFVFPSFYESESLPGAIIEAMSHSMPIIATDWRGIPTLVNNENGVLISTRDTASLTKQMNRYAKSPDLIKSQGKKSRVKYENKFTLDVFHRNLKEILNEV